MVRTTYGYARVSSADQSLDRQIAQLREHVTDERYILCDKASGKDFNRKEYNSLVGTVDSAPRLQRGDLLVVTSLDRLGRNYVEIREQWEHVTKTLGADIKVLDMPLLDTTADAQTLDKQFIADLVLQILSYTAQKERESIRKRQREGIDAMPIVDGQRISRKTNRPVGRPKAEYPTEWESVHTAWKGNQITAKAAMQQLGLKVNTFYKLANQYAEQSR
jgi:DNA invertase Pin-like site-specific DNA recombinase